MLAERVKDWLNEILSCRGSMEKSWPPERWEHCFAGAGSSRPTPGFTCEFPGPMETSSIVWLPRVYQITPSSSLSGMEPAGSTLQESSGLFRIWREKPWETSQFSMKFPSTPTSLGRHLAPGSSSDLNWRPQFRANPDPSPSNHNINHIDHIHQIV